MILDRIVVFVAALMCVAASTSFGLVVWLLAYPLPTGVFGIISVVFGALALLTNGFAAFLSGACTWQGIKEWHDG